MGPLSKVTPVDASVGIPLTIPTSYVAYNPILRGSMGFASEATTSIPDPTGWALFLRGSVFPGGSVQPESANDRQYISNTESMFLGSCLPGLSFNSSLGFALA